MKTELTTSGDSPVFIKQYKGAIILHHSDSTITLFEPEAIELRDFLNQLDLGGEIWVNVKGFEEYYSVSNTGFVRSKDRKMCHPKTKGGYCTKKGRVLRKLIGSGDGSASVELYGDGVKIGTTINKLVYEAFVGSVPDGKNVLSIDGDKMNNKVGNLYIKLDLVEGVDNG